MVVSVLSFGYNEVGGTLERMGNLGVLIGERGLKYGLFMEWFQMNDGI